MARRGEGRRADILNHSLNDVQRKFSHAGAAEFLDDPVGLLAVMYAIRCSGSLIISPVSIDNVHREGNESQSSLPGSSARVAEVIRPSPGCDSRSDLT